MFDDNPFLSGSALDALSQWSNTLKSFQSRIGPYFARSEARQSAFDYLQGLMSPVARKNGWQMAEQVGHQTPYAIQHLLGRARWQADEVGQESCQYLLETLGRDDGILAVDETGFIKQGDQSVGVQVQHCSLTGRLENCQVGVFLAYVTPEGHSLIDRRLYLPRSWCHDPVKREKAAVPEEIAFATKPQLAQQMLKAAFEAGVRPRWVVADEVYGNDGKFWWWLEQQYQQPYLLTVASSHSVSIGYQEHRVKDLAQALVDEQWQRLSCGDGSKGERLYDWARIEMNCANEHGMKRWLLLRRNLETPDDPRSITYYQGYGPATTTLEDMVAVAGQRWRIEECFGFAKDRLGLSDYEVRSWQGWHRHMTLVMAAQAFLTVLRHQFEPVPMPKKSLGGNGMTPNSMAAFKAARGLLSH